MDMESMSAVANMVMLNLKDMGADYIAMAFGPFICTIIDELIDAGKLAIVEPGE